MTAEFHINLNDYFELKNLVSNVYYPLKELVDKKNFLSIVNNFKTISGEIFPIPIFLDIDNDFKKKLKLNKRFNIKLNDSIVGCITVKDIYTINKKYVSKKLFGTSDEKHVGVKNFLNKKEYFVGGKIDLLDNKTIEKKYNYLQPIKSIERFRRNNWKTIVGFQTRNIPHRAHEHLLRVSLEYVDGLFVQPLVGYKKSGDFSNEAVFRTYEYLIQNYFPKNKVVLGSLNSAMWYAGPREAVFHAIIRKNYGCTHFIVGRDHAGIGNYYGKYDSQKIFKQFKESLNIKILKLGGPYYCKFCDGIVSEHSCPHYNNPSFKVNHISGTDVRKSILNNKYISKKYVRPEILKILKSLNRVFI